MLASTAVVAGAASAQSTDDYRVVPGTVCEWQARTSMGPTHSYSVAEVTHIRNFNDRRFLLSVKSENRPYWTRKVVAWGDFDYFRSGGLVTRSWWSDFWGNLASWARRIADVFQYVADLPETIKKTVSDILHDPGEITGTALRQSEANAGAQRAARACIILAGAVKDGQAQGWIMSRRVAEGFRRVTQNDGVTATGFSQAIVDY